VGHGVDRRMTSWGWMQKRGAGKRESGVWTIRRAFFLFKKNRWLAKMRKNKELIPPGSAIRLCSRWASQVVLLDLYNYFCVGFFLMV
jgi:hypothetical protein